MPDSEQRRDRILYLSKVFPYPPAVSGDAVYTRGIIEAWSSAADLTVVCADSGAARDNGIAEVDWKIVAAPRSGRARSVLSTWPLIAWKGATPAYLHEVASLLERDDWDAVVLDNIGLAHALPSAEAYRASHPGTKLIYIAHEWEHSNRVGKYRKYRMNPALRLIAELDLKKVKHWEHALIRRCDIVTVINTSDLAPFREIDPARKYLPITPGYDGSVRSARHITEEIPRRVLMLGGRRSEQKQQVLLDWLAAAYDRLLTAGIELVVAGDMSDDLYQQILTEYPGVRVLGFVDDLSQIIGEARAGLIADTVGGGFKLRLLTHVFQRLPMVGLAAAIDGLPTPAGEGYLTATSLDELSTLICTVVDDLESLNAVQNRAFDDCTDTFSWQERSNLLRHVVRDRTGANLW